MPNFLLPIVLIDGYAFFEIYRRVLQNPTSMNQVYWLLFFAYLAGTLTISLLLFFILVKRNPQLPNTRPLLRKALKIGGLVMLGPILYLALRAGSLASTLNTTLLVLLYVMILLKIKPKNR